MPKATPVFDADDSRLSGALARINSKMLALQSRIAKFAAAFIAIRAVAGVVTAGFDQLPLRRLCGEHSAFAGVRYRAGRSSRRSMSAGSLTISRPIRALLWAPSLCCSRSSPTRASRWRTSGRCSARWQSRCKAVEAPASMQSPLRVCRRALPRGAFGGRHDQEARHQSR